METLTVDKILTLQLAISYVMPKMLFSNPITLDWVPQPFSLYLENGFRSKPEQLERKRVKNNFQAIWG